ncbi:Uma2 family endonuclease [Streptomyces sp. NPDC101776]|uniref:Uma2 family endonuclease n=1 Tax=Streptomyces sp. NPDC101776 TaxID=3366146 RepID=UPI00382A8CBF
MARGTEPGQEADSVTGEIVLTVGPDLVHNAIVATVQDQIPRTGWRRLQTQRVAIPEEPNEPQPDLVVIERGTGPDRRRLMPAGAATLLVEVVSTSSVHRDYSVKCSIYAAAEVPGYLIIDPVMAQCVLLTEPTGTGEDADYRTPLEPICMELDTSEFAAYENVTPHRYP